MKYRIIYHPKYGFHPQVRDFFFNTLWTSAKDSRDEEIYFATLEEAKKYLLEYKDDLEFSKTKIVEEGVL